MAPFVGATGNPTTLAETVFSTIPGSPVYASKASHYTARRRARTASRAWTSRATTPSRATSASRPDARADGRPMFAPAHLRVPRRDRAILGGSLVALAAGRLARAVAVGGLAVRRATSTTTAAARPGRRSRPRCSRSAGC